MGSFFQVKTNFLFVQIRFALDDVQNLIDKNGDHVVASLDNDLCVLKVNMVAWMFTQVYLPV